MFFEGNKNPRIEGVTHFRDGVTVAELGELDETVFDYEYPINIHNPDASNEIRTLNYALLIRACEVLGCSRERVFELFNAQPESVMTHPRMFISIHDAQLFHDAVKKALHERGVASEEGSAMNPRFHLPLGHYSARHQSWGKALDVLLKALPLKKLYSDAPLYNRQLNNTHLHKRVYNGNGQAIYIGTYFANLRCFYSFTLDKWVQGLYSGLPCARGLPPAESSMDYCQFTVDEVLNRDYTYLGLSADNAKVLSENVGGGERKRWLWEGREFAHEVVLPKAVLCSERKKIAGRRLLYDHEVYEPTPFEVEEAFAETEDLKKAIDERRAAQVTLIDADIRIGGEVVFRAGEMYGAPYSMYTFRYPQSSFVRETARAVSRSVRALVSLRDAVDEEVALARQEAMRANRERDASERKSQVFQKYTRSSLVERVDAGEDPTQDVPSLTRMAVLFTDIRNFTPFTERMDADAVVGFLNDYFDRMNKPIITCRGEIDKLMGDCIMAGFHDGSDPDTAVTDAVEAAVRIRRELQALNRERWEAFQRQEAGEGTNPFTRINNGVGITFGEVVRGNIGSSDKLDHTLIGDVVNMGQRLEALTKDYGLSILVSEDVARRLGNGCRTRFIDRVLVKGKSRALTVYEVFDHEPDRIAELKLANEPRMREAYTAYFAGHFEDALAVYEELREAAGRHSYLSGMCADPVLDFYARRCRSLIHRRDAKLLDLETWDGVYNVLDEVPSEKAIPITKLGQIVLQQETMEGNSLEYLLDMELTETRKFTRAEAGTVYVVDETGQLRFGYFQNDAMPLDLERISRTLTSNRTIPVNEESIAGYVALTGETLHLPDVYDLPAGVPYRFEAGFDHESGYRTKSMLCVPIRDIHGKVLGVLQLINAKNRELVVEFSEEDIAYARFFAHFTANAIKRAEENRRKLLDMAAMVESYDRDETGRHNTRVGEYAAELYQQWAVSRGLAEREILAFKDRLRLGAMLHDAGKIGISTAVLNKPGKLTEEEFGLMQTHTVNSTNYFHDKEESPWSEVAANIALYHHEKWDGTGYPERLSGEAIPLCARVVAVADVYDALVSKRSYKDGMPHDKARQIVVDGSGTHFDPAMVEAFVRIEDVVKGIRERYA